ncbi:MAG: SprB repeat-containing protein [Bacteroidetes bacterium]|nr:SprB repeat-containing protein [Bacteroidota bacterium]
MTKLRNVSGTTANFSYAFLTVGNYSITHTVINAGCTATVTGNVNVINCTGPTVTATGSSVCNGSCASVTSSGTGGTSPYIYSWSNGATTQNISACPATTATYTVKVTDAVGTTATSTAVIIVNPAINVTVTPTNLSCNGSANGSAIANPTNGTAPYTYSWSAGGQTTNTTTGMAQGNYTVTITDAKSCTATATTAIIAPPPLTGQFSKGTASCAGCGCKVWVLITAAGGTSPYNYTWPDGYINRYKNQLCPGAYLINIKDKNGCSVNVSIPTP